MSKTHTDASLVPYLTPRTCTDPSCNGSCGRKNHPAAIPADEEVAGCG
jgi:hypothetical protein